MTTKPSPRPFPKGRQVDPAVRAEVSELLGEAPRRRDLLIEFLHRLNDRLGHLSVAHLAALAAELRLAQAEVYEVATFYHHFRIIHEGQEPPSGPPVRVCTGPACALKGAEDLHAHLAERLGPRVEEAPCMGACHRAPAVHVGWRLHAPADAATVEDGAIAGRVAAEVTPTEAWEPAMLADCLDGRRSREWVLDTLDDSGLRGLGGAGFPAARKWRLVAEQPGPRHVVVNADEGEPGTFKDRHCLETAPGRVLEGALVAAWTVEADAVWIYVRDEYPAARALLATEAERLFDRFAGRLPAIHVRRGAGAYICGEESALLESLEGRRGLPRHKPPYPVEKGLFGRPTLMHNVETLYWLPAILARGADWYAATRPRLFSVSGRVRDPGVKQAPSGITVQQLIDDHCGGMAAGHAFGAYLPGGASGGILPASMADIPLDFGGRLGEEGCFVGSAGIIVLSDRDDLRAVARNLMRFFAEESCGQCTPCRLGTEKALSLMAADTWDAALLSELGACMRDASICGLGQAAPNVFASILRHFDGGEAP